MVSPRTSASPKRSTVKNSFEFDAEVFSPPRTIGLLDEPRPRIEELPLFVIVSVPVPVKLPVKLTLLPAVLIALVLELSSVKFWE